jgi:hypothetical protein
MSSFADRPETVCKRWARRRSIGESVACSLHDNFTGIHYSGFSFILQTSMIALSYRLADAEQDWF